MKAIEAIDLKAYTLEKLLTQVAAWKLKGKTVAFTNGCFDILHHGHLDLIAKAADQGNILVVGINSDASVKRLKGAERPINNENDRAFQMASLANLGGGLVCESLGVVPINKELLRKEALINL